MPACRQRASTGWTSWVNSLGGSVIGGVRLIWRGMLSWSVAAAGGGHISATCAPSWRATPIMCRSNGRPGRGDSFLPQPFQGWPDHPISAREAPTWPGSFSDKGVEMLCQVETKAYQEPIKKGFPLGSPWISRQGSLNMVVIQSPCSRGV